jgi:hypothetical protein
VAIIMTRAAVAVVVAIAAVAIVVIPITGAMLPTAAIVVAVESVWVATPNRVPEVTGTPLRERPGLGLGHGSRSYTDEPQT